MALNNISTACRNAACNGYVDQVDVGATDPTGDIQIYSAGFATLLAELEFSNPAFGAAAVGVATAAAITGETSAPASGTAAVCRVRDRANATCWQGSVGTAGADVILNSVAITIGQTVDLSAAVFTVPAS